MSNNSQDYYSLTTCEWKADSSMKTHGSVRIGRRVYSVVVMPSGDDCHMVTFERAGGSVTCEVQETMYGWAHWDHEHQCRSNFSSAACELVSMEIMGVPGGYEYRVKQFVKLSERMGSEQREQYEQELAGV